MPMPNKAKSEAEFVIFSMRINEGLRRKLKAEAVKNNRTLAAEMVTRLQASLPQAKRRAQSGAHAAPAS